MKLDAALVRLLKSQSLLKQHIAGVLKNHARRFPGSAASEPDLQRTSAVLFLLGGSNCRSARHEGPCLILNKRSSKVKQPGDLCCPGGGIERHIDPIVARFLTTPLSPLRRHPAWQEWLHLHTDRSRQLGLLMAASLREGLEEMRLNPFRFEFLGALPLQRLVLFKREIFPLVGWMRRQKRFYPNWEVSDIIYIPLRHLLDPSRYARYRLDIETAAGQIPYEKEFLCFQHVENDKAEILWGATFRITMNFLELVFGFGLPAPENLPEVKGILKESYFK